VKLEVPASIRRTPIDARPARDGIPQGDHQQRGAGISIRWGREWINTSSQAGMALQRAAQRPSGWDRSRYITLSVDLVTRTTRSCVFAEGANTWRAGDDAHRAVFVAGPVQGRFYLSLAVPVRSAIMR